MNKEDKKLLSDIAYEAHILGTVYDKLEKMVEDKRTRHLSSRSSGAATQCPQCGEPLIMGVCEVGCGYIHHPPPA